MSTKYQGIERRDTTLNKESFFTIKVWAVILLVAVFLGWSGVTLFSHEGRIAKTEMQSGYLVVSITEIKDTLKQIQADMKDNLKEARDNRKR